MSIGYVKSELIPGYDFQYNSSIVDQFWRGKQYIEKNETAISQLSPWKISVNRYVISHLLVNTPAKYPCLILSAAKY